MIVIYVGLIVMTDNKKFVISPRSSNLDLISHFGWQFHGHSVRLTSLKVRAAQNGNKRKKFVDTTDKSFFLSFLLESMTNIDPRNTWRNNGKNWCWGCKYQNAVIYTTGQEKARFKQSQIINPVQKFWDHVNLCQLDKSLYKLWFPHKRQLPGTR